MADVRTIEEYLRGPDGVEEKGIRRRLAEVQAEAKSRGVSRIAVEIRTTPTGTSSGRSEGHANFGATDPLDAVIEALRRKLEDAPGEHFAGELRLNFRAQGDTAENLGSYTRQMRPALSPGGLVATNGGTLPGDVASLSAIIHGIVKPTHDNFLRGQDVSIRQAEANARVAEALGKGLEGLGKAIEAINPKPATPTSPWGLVSNLLGNATQIGAANDQATRQGGGSGGGNGSSSSASISEPSPPAPPGLVPPVAPPSSPPGPPSGARAALPGPAPEVDEEAVRRWLAANQSRGVQLGMEFADQAGFMLVPKGA